VGRNWDGDLNMKLRNGVFGLTLTSAVALAASSALAADVYGPAGGYKDEPAYVAVNWSGFYAGVNAGYGWSANSDISGFQPTGGFGGGQIGYNWQGVFGLGRSWVVGVEADIQGSGIEDSVSDGFASAKSSLNWFGTVRGRIGYAFGPALVYATGGFAFGEVENSASLGFLSARVSETQTGYVVGGGLEYKVNPSWSVKGEYQFISLDASDPNGAGPLGFTSSDRSEVHTLRVGLNYHFGEGYAPLK
jgi:outer membrane immunogenic protein